MSPIIPNVGPTNLTEALAFYRAKGIPITPIGRATKVPTRKRWNLPSTPAMPDAAFREVDKAASTITEHNVGMLLGSPVRGAFLHDVDIDLKDPWVLTILDYLLFPESPTWVFGRAGKPRSHRVYLCPQPIQGRAFLDIHGQTAIELRGTTKDGKYTQTVAPGSIRGGEPEEPILFVSPLPDMPATIDGEALFSVVRNAAVAIAIAQCWPNGQRHKACLAWAGVLRDFGVDKNDARAILEAVTLAMESEVWSDAANCVRDTYDKSEDTAAISTGWIRANTEDGDKAIKALRRSLDVKPEGINVSVLDLGRLTPDVWKALADKQQGSERGPKLFQRGDTLVRLDYVPDKRDEGKPRFKLIPLTDTILTNELTRTDTGLRFYTVGKKDQPVIVPPPGQLVRNMLSERPKSIPLPSISRIVHAPIVAPDGTINTTKGYHAATGTFYVQGSLALRPISPKPSAAEVQAAVEQLLAPLADFPFREEASRTHALAFMLLPFVRDLINGPTPLHLIQKPQPGVGATLLSEVIFAPSAGESVAQMSQAQTDEEWEKVLTATFLEGANIVQLDNVTELASGKLAKAITDSVWKGRILGQSRMMEARVTCVFGATGNNPRLSTEIGRRIVPINLVPLSSLPWLRSGFTIQNMTQWLVEHRGDMVHAALTLIRAWFGAGAPRRTDLKLGKFEEYIEIMGGILRLAGREDFLGNLLNLYESNDVEGDALTWLAETWQGRHADAQVKQSEVALWALGPGTPVSEYLNADASISGASKFARWLRSLTDRVVSVRGVAVAFRVTKDSTHANRTYWRVVSLDGQVVAPDPELADASNPF